MEQSLYMMKDIIAGLVAKGYKISRPTFQQYERNGVIMTPMYCAAINDKKKVRLYTKDEKDANVDRVIAYIKQKRSKTLL